MPYIPKPDRERVLEEQAANSPGELNFLLTTTINEYLLQGTMNYQTLNEIMGVLECVKQEFYRRVVAPYEQEKMKTNGDVYY